MSHFFLFPGVGLLPLTGEEEECGIPSLEEASKMASESNLNIRKSKLQSTNSNTEETAALISDNSAEDDDEWLDDGLDQDVLLEEIERLEDHVKKLDVQQYMDNVRVVQPYYSLQEDGGVIGETQKKIGLQFAQKRCFYVQLRPQRFSGLWKCSGIHLFAQDKKTPSCEFSRENPPLSPSAPDPERVFATNCPPICTRKESLASPWSFLLWFPSWRIK